MIPSFPDFIPISLDHREALSTHLRAHPPLASEYTFTNLYAWGEVAGYHLCRYGAGFLIRKGSGAEMAFLQPLVVDDPLGAVRACHAYLREQGAIPAIHRVGEDFLARAYWAAAGITKQENRDDFDYVYDVPALIELAGPKFHDKKNLLHQFQRKFAYQYRTLTSALVEECLTFQHHWCEDRECDKHEGLFRENCAVHRMLSRFAALQLLGGIIEVDGQVVAMELGERLNDDTLVIHVEKAKGSLPGVYQAINREFLAHEGAGFRFVNREQDLGLPGLRKAKESYNPVRLVRKYSLLGA